MARTRTTRAALLILPATGLTLALTGCASSPAPVAASDALWAQPMLTVASADGFVVGDALGMTMLAGLDVRLADVTEPFEFAD